MLSSTAENWRVGEVEQYVWVLSDLLLVLRVASQAFLEDFLKMVQIKKQVAFRSHLHSEKYRSLAVMSSN